jgi:hypothetical protein
MIEQFVAAVMRAIEEQRTVINMPLLDGSCTDFPDYKYSAGQLRGLALAEREIKDLAEKWKKAQDE